LTWLVGSSGAKKAPGLIRFFSRFFYRVFELPSPRNVQKRDKKIEKKSVLDFLVDFFKNFSTRFVCKTFFVVLLNSHRQETPENAIKQKKLRKN
jgi:hypothetical protein